MSADEEFGRILIERFPDFWGIPPRVAANVRDPYIDTLAHKSVVEGIGLPNPAVVDIAIDRPESAQFLQFIGYFNGSKIAGMPNFIRLAGVFFYAIVHIAVRIAEEKDFCHDLAFKSQREIRS